MKQSNDICIPANKAEEIRKYFEDLYIEYTINVHWLDDSRRDDPGDWDQETEQMNEYSKKAAQAEMYAELFGGLDKNRCFAKIQEYIY